MAPAVRFPDSVMIPSRPYNVPVRMPISCTSLICEIMAGVSAITVPENMPYSTAKTMMPATLPCKGIQNAQTTSVVRNVKTIAVLYRPTRSAAQVGIVRPITSVFCRQLCIVDMFQPFYSRAQLTAGCVKNHNHFAGQIIRHSLFLRLDNNVVVGKQQSRIHQHG